MCGIAGIAGVNDTSCLERMCEALVHRGPDDLGVYRDHGMAFGMRRLAIIDLAGGRQPISNEDGSVWIVFNGEIYNFPEIRSDLLRRGHTFSTCSDTEVIVHLYEEYGEECVAKLRGMFAFALWDRERARLLLVRDRLGVKPLVYNFDGERLLFASEIKALLAADPCLNEFDAQALNYFLTYLYVPAPKTMFRSIQKLLPGQMLIYENGSIRLRKYWQLDPFPEGGASRPKPSRAETMDQALNLLAESVRMRMLSDVPLGAFLSGGMDSASLVAFMSEHSSGPVKTFTIGYGDEDSSYNELASARMISQAFGTEHHEFILKPDVTEILPEIVYAFGEPFADSSAIPTFLISQETRKHVTVALSGIGGDEVFLGYPRYLGAWLSGVYQSLPLFVRKNMVLPIAEMLPESTRSRNTGGWIKRFARGGLMDPVGRYLSWISFLNREAKESLYSEDLRELLKDHDVTDIHRRSFCGDKRLEYVKSVSHLDLTTYLPDDLLLMGDAMSMAHSLELRVPFCDHHLVEFLFHLPCRLKMSGFRLKGMFRSMMKGRLPEQILNKKKQGFMVPIGSWFRRDLQGYIREILQSERARSRGFFNPRAVSRMLDDHFRGGRVLTHQIWALLTFEVWCRLYMDREGIPAKQRVLSEAV